MLHAPYSVLPEEDTEKSRELIAMRCQQKVERLLSSILVYWLAEVENRLSIFDFNLTDLPVCVS